MTFPNMSLNCKLDPVQYREHEYGLLGERERERRITYQYQYKHQTKTKGRRDRQREPIVPVASTIFLKHSTEILTRQKKKNTHLRR